MASALARAVCSSKNKFNAFPFLGSGVSSGPGRHFRQEGIPRVPHEERRVYEEAAGGCRHPDHPHRGPRYRIHHEQGNILSSTPYLYRTVKDHDIFFAERSRANL